MSLRKGRRWKAGSLVGTDPCNAVAPTSPRHQLSPSPHPTITHSPVLPLSHSSPPKVSPSGSLRAEVRGWSGKARPPSPVFVKRAHLLADAPHLPNNETMRRWRPQISRDVPVAKQTADSRCAGFINGDGPSGRNNTLRGWDVFDVACGSLVHHPATCYIIQVNTGPNVSSRIVPEPAG
jgi:hypothetical protein